MPAHMRKHPIEKVSNVIVKLEDTRPMSVEDFILENFAALPKWAVALRGYRNRESLTQSALGGKLGIAQTNISQMELGKRSIGKSLAKKFADFFKTDYHLFL